MKILKDYFFTSESVASGHPDKICDQISDSILDEFLRKDPESRVAAEVMVTPRKIVIAGETRGPEEITHECIEKIARDCVRDIGYEQELFHWQKIQIENLMIKQSKDIAMGVDASSDKPEGAGDQGIMFGYACDETDQLMPAAIYYAHRILQNIENAIKKNEIVGLGPDAKSQVTLRYVNNVPVAVSSVVVSIQHVAKYCQADVKEIIRPYVVSAFPEGFWECKESDFYVNPTGLFIIGGPESDSGLTGRKIIVDTYGGAAPHGGGAFSGKDPSKVDRSAAYIARYLAKNVIAAKLAKKCTIQISYAIGVAKPLSFYVNTHNTGVLDEARLASALWDLVDLSPMGIKSRLQLKRPIYKKTATYGHFGRLPGLDGSFSWEKLDLVDDLKLIL